jgi:hypothetical protein
MNRETKNGPYCSITLHPCREMVMKEKIGDFCGGRSSVQIHETEVCTCHQEETIDRRRALQSWWADRGRRERRKRMLPKDSKAGPRAGAA